MTMILLAEHAPDDATLLALGAGGGFELKVFAEVQPNGRFVGVDPSAKMLDLARRTLDRLETRVAWHKGDIDTAPSGPYDGATCLLTLHFLPKDQRLHTLRAIHCRLKPRARLVAAHHSYPKTGDHISWLSRSIAFARRVEVDIRQANALAAAMAARLHVISADEDEVLLAEASFSNIDLFHAGFSSLAGSQRYEPQSDSRADADYFRADVNLATHRGRSSHPIFAARRGGTCACAHALRSA